MDSASLVPPLSLKGGRPAGRLRTALGAADSQQEVTGDNGQVSTTRTSKRTDCRSLPTLAGHKTHRHGLAAARGGPLRERRLDHGAPVHGPPPAYRKEKPRHARSDVSHLSGSPGPPWAEPPSPASSPTPAARTRSTAPGWQRPQDLCTCPSRCLEHFPHILTWPAPSGRSLLGLNVPSSNSPSLFLCYFHGYVSPLPHCSA